ncbi:MAG: rod-binding protein [Holophaga sp.]|nr:rod-binding protein [Holophaga sp.]
MSGLPPLAQAAPQEIVAQSMPGPGSNPGGNAEAAKQFEGMLMAFVFQQMRKTVQPSGLFGDTGMARSTYEYLLDQAVTSNAMDAGKGWGLSQQLAAKWNAPTTK